MNAASVDAANKKNETISSGVRTTGVTVVEDEVVKNTGLMVDVVSTWKPLGIKLEASGNKTKSGIK